MFSKFNKLSTFNKFGKFGKLKELKEHKLPSTHERFDTFVGETTEIHGRLLLLNSVRIDGKVVGNIEASKNTTVTVAIGLKGAVHGDISAHRVIVAGKVDGNIYATERAEFHKEADVRGDVTYGSIAVEPGARLLGLMTQMQVSPAPGEHLQRVIAIASENAGDPAPG